MMLKIGYKANTVTKEIPAHLLRRHVLLFRLLSRGANTLVEWDLHQVAHRQSSRANRCRLVKPLEMRYLPALRLDETDDRVAKAENIRHARKE